MEMLGKENIKAFFKEGIWDRIEVSLCQDAF